MSRITRREALRSGSAALLSASLAPLAARCGGSLPDYDVCIVGSGFAGLFLGLRLAQHGVRTAILEAGPDLKADASDEGRADLFPYATAGSLEFPVDANRTIGVGGTSRRWHGVISRLLPADFRTRSEFGIWSDWPIEYGTLAPYYCEAEAALGTAGGPFLPGSEPERDCPYPAELDEYVSPAPLLQPAEVSFIPLAAAYPGGGPLRLDRVQVPEFRGLPAAALLSEHAVTRLVASNRRTIAAVDARRPDGSLVRVRARCFVVAAGVVETARLLLTSSSRPFPGGPGNAGGLLGTHFHAHPIFRMFVPAAATLPLPPGTHRTYSFNDRMRRESVNAFHLDMYVGSEGATVDVTVELEPSPDRRIHLDRRRTDGWGRPIAVLQADWTPRDRLTVERARTAQREIVARMARRDPIAQAAIEDAGSAWFHPAGGCRMAADERHGVVDAHCKVFGTENLYVLGASVFPVSGSGNPTLTIVALAFRLADQLRTLLAA